MFDIKRKKIICTKWFTQWLPSQWWWVDQNGGILTLWASTGDTESCQTRTTCQSSPEPEHWCARLKIVMTFLDWKEIHCLWYPYSLISIKTTLAWHKDIWVSQCSPKMPFILKILPLSLSPFKSKILECFYTMERDYLKEANPLTFDRHHRHVIVNMNSVHWTPSSTWTSSSK